VLDIGSPFFRNHQGILQLYERLSSYAFGTHGVLRLRTCIGDPL
jgi:hypothetical protein